MPPNALNASHLVPARVQPKLPLDQLLVKVGTSAAPDAAPTGETLPMDVVFVGAGPAGLCGAIELKRLAKADAEKGGTLGELEVAVLEKSEELGQHCLSGAVVNPSAFRELFPDVSVAELPLRAAVQKEAVYLLTQNGQVKLPTPPTMRNHGNHVASICEIVRWLGAKAEAAGVNLFTGFPVASLRVDGKRVAGVRTAASGLERDGLAGANATPPTDVEAKVTVLTDGTRSSLAQAWMASQQVESRNPQIYALGVKELWETKVPLDSIVHTLGWPLPGDAFGGSFMYPLEPNLVAVGIVVGLDYHDSGLDVHALLQRMKQHPLFRKQLEGGELVEWGAKTIPEGGYWSLPGRRCGDGIVLAGDAAGFVDVPSLKGIHYAMWSGIFAARAIFAALKKGDTSWEGLRDYDRMVNDSVIARDLYKTRNMRLAFKNGFFVGGLQAGVMTLTGGKLFGGHVKVEEDAAEAKRKGEPMTVATDGKLTFSKVDAVFKSGNQTRDSIPSHLLAPIEQDLDAATAQLYASMCPAGVYELVDGRLRVNAPNCIDCKATDVLGPRWTPREGGSGPRYRRM